MLHQASFIWSGVYFPIQKSTVLPFPVQAIPSHYGQAYGAGCA